MTRLVLTFVAGAYAGATLALCLVEDMLTGGKA